MLNYSDISGARPEPTLESFLPDDSNLHALMLCERGAAQNLVILNPLWIRGPAGCGKTHLLKGIAGRIREEYPEKTVLYLTADQLLSELVDRLMSGIPEEELWKPYDVDVLLLDDLQAVAGRPSVQECLSGFLLSRCRREKQSVLASDCHPQELGVLTYCLAKSEYFISVAIRDPGVALKKAFLKQYCDSRRISLPDDVIACLARRRTYNLPRLQGAVQKIQLLSPFCPGPISPEWVRKYI